MKLITYQQGSEIRIGLLQANENVVIDARTLLEYSLTRQNYMAPAREAARLIPADMTMLLQRGLEPVFEALDLIGQIEPIASTQIRLLAPLPRPGKIIGVGRNYAAHAAEGGLEAQQQPRLFTKVPSSVIGPGDIIPKPARVNKLDWEVELAVVIGRRMHDVNEQDALSYVAGYTILNDVSAREFQFDVKPPQTSFAKSMDGFCPLGPCLLTADEIADLNDITLRCRVNDQLMQHGNTSDMIFPVPYLLSYISRYLTLEPGDIIATGTPDGVGAFRKPPVYLQPGDRIRMEIAPIGILENTVGAGGSV
jgi:2-keto-4-pentenoate hydratase/2-oxohepta-3-ene-1,7-dioic acid hydratase in catechol pathway